MVAFGQEFIIAYPAVVILSIGQLVSAMCGSTGVFMNMTGNQKMYRNILIVTSVANIILNFLFIPSFGIYGAAIVSMLSTAGWNIFTLFFIKNKYGFNIGFFPFLSILHFECNMPRK
jgi:O-antigen/teichoic acid export membrane protein